MRLFLTHIFHGGLSYKFKRTHKICGLIIFLTFSPSSFAADLDLPRFMSLKVSEANIRTGPGSSFSIKWILVKKNIPLFVFDAFDNWYKVKDEEGKTGWVHKSLVSSRQYFVTIEESTSLYKHPGHELVLFKLEAGVRGRVRSCRNSWCEVSIGKYRGWLRKSSIWGESVKKNSKAVF
jgi:SH3-like domain-containing protein